MLQRSGWQTARDRVERIWRCEGLKVPQKQRPPRQLWLHDGSCIRLRPERANSVWSYDFVNAWKHEGRLLRTLALIDEFTRECLALRVARRLNSQEVIEQWRQQYDRVRPHAALAYRPPAPGAYIPPWNPVPRPQMIM